MQETKKCEIHVKGGFSERKGIKNFSDIVQVDSLNDRTRNKLYVATEAMLHKHEKKLQLIEYIYTEIFSLTTREIPIASETFAVFGTYYDKVEQEIMEQFKTLKYNEIFDFIEGILRGIRTKTIKDSYIENINKIFIDENVNYRIVKNVVTDLIDEELINEIEETLKNPYDVVSTHFEKALKLLYVVKDYDNSIKESISSVEAMCQIITGDDKATLGDALKKFKNEIHPALKSAFNKLYGYTSDANGIRHSNGLGEGNSTFGEAKYMLISCSAFVNYLKENFENK